jgi:hypothetical protein
VDDTLDRKGMNMNHTLMLAAVGAVMTLGCGTEQMETQESTASGSANTMQGLVKEKTHCVVQAIAVERGQALPAGIAPPQASCFDTFAEAISHATKGAVKLGPQATVRELKGADMQAAGVAAIEYDYANLSGQSLTLSAGTTCASANLLMSSMPSNWDNRISSAVLYDSSCISFVHFTEPNFQGSGGNCGAGCNLLGSLDNQTSSIYMSSL